MLMGFCAISVVTHRVASAPHLPQVLGQVSAHWKLFLAHVHFLNVFISLFWFSSVSNTNAVFLLLLVKRWVLVPVD